MAGGQGDKETPASETKDSPPARRPSRRDPRRAAIEVSQESFKKLPEKVEGTLPKMPGSEHGSGHSCSFPLPSTKPAGRGGNCGVEVGDRSQTMSQPRPGPSGAWTSGFGDVLSSPSSFKSGPKSSLGKL